MRIIAGTARGRSFEAPKGRTTRPTLARVKEAMFGMVQFEIEDRHVLDLFAGSGSLGFEALSRGAEKAVFCDQDRNAANIIKKNAELLGFSDKASVVCADCFAALKQLAAAGERFSLVLLDPPYAAGLTEGAVKELKTLGLLEDGCIILAEHSRKLPLNINIEDMICREPRYYGDTAVTLIRYCPGR